MATIAVENTPVTNSSGVIYKSAEKLYLKDVVAAQSAPTAVIDAASNLQEYQWIMFGVALTAGANPTYTVQSYYWDDALKAYVLGDSDTGDANRLFVFKSYGRKVAARVTAMANITSFSMSAGGFNGDE